MKKITTFLFAFVLCTSTILGITPVITMTTAKAIGSTFSFKLGANAYDTPIQVDFGNGVIVNDTIGPLGDTISGILLGSQTVKVYGPGIEGLNCDTEQLTVLNVSNDTILEYLHCNKNELTSLEITNNNSLKELWTSDNQLATLNVSKNTLLGVLVCNNNQLKTIDVSTDTALTWFECTSNQITSLDISNNKAMTALYCDNNLLTTLDVGNNTLLEWFSCSNNFLRSLNVSMNLNLVELSCGNNQFTFATLPLRRASWTYFYVPQTPINIIKSISIGAMLDLSDLLSVNGNITSYTWKTKGGEILIEGTDYAISNGKTTFLKAQTDSVYCEMINAAFPDFTVNNVFKTVCTKITGSSDVINSEISEPEIYSHYKTLHITSPYNAQLSVFDMNGRLIMSGYVYSGKKDIQLHNTGVYLVKVTGNKDSVTRKIFVE